MGIFSEFFSLLSLCLRVFTLTSPHRQNSLIHYTISTQSSLFGSPRFQGPLPRLPVDIGCPVSRKFPHGTLHYQSRKVFVLPSRRSYFLRSASHVRIYSDFPLFLSGTGVFFSPSLLPLVSKSFPISLATTFGISVDLFPWY